MEVHNLPEAIDTNTSAEIGKSEKFTDYHGISRFGGRKKGRKLFGRGQEIAVVAGYTEMSELDPTLLATKGYVTGWGRRLNDIPALRSRHRNDT